MNIILINPPPYRHVEEYDLPTWQHLGIGRLSSYIRQYGHQVTLIDAKLQRFDMAAVLEIIQDKKPDLVGLTAMTPDISNAYSLARQIKSINSGITTVIGGCHATAMPEETLREEQGLDFVVAGEGERTFKELVEVLEKSETGRDLSKVPGILYRSADKIIKTPLRLWDNHLEELPLPDWQLSRYASHYKLETSRGCPFKCNYCMRVLGETVRHFPIQQILNELKNVMQHKDKLTMEIVDETFTLNPKRIDEMLDGMIDIGVGKKIKWFCSTRANLVTPELLEKMKKAGCYRVVFGVESGNQHILDRSKKNIKLESVVKAVKLTRRAKIESFCGFILGHPDEKLGEMIDTINFAVRCNPHIAALGTMVPYPGTEVWEIAKNGGGNYKLLSTDWNEYNRQFSYVLELEDVSKRDMDKLQLVGTLKLFIYNRRFLDLIKFVLSYRREAIQFFKMIFSKKTDKGSNISLSRLSFLKLTGIFFSRVKRETLYDKGIAKEKDNCEEKIYTF